MLSIILIIPTLIIGFFSLYILSKHDFVLIRKNVSVNQIFDLSLISIAIALITGRIFFIINEARMELLSPIQFFHILRYPGISMLGFFVGGAICIWFLFKKTKALRRIYDIFTISFFPVFLFHLTFRQYRMFSMIISVVIFILGMAFWSFIIRSHQKYFLKDCSISYLIMVLVSCDALFYFFFSVRRIIVLNLSILQIASVIFLIASIFMFWVNQKQLFTKD